jgi:glycosyltransferase involved in cell wall biosynthesis
MKVLFLTGDLEYRGTNRQLTLLATHLPRDRFDVTVGVLGRSGPWAEELDAAGIRVERFGWTRLVDPRPFARLRQVARHVRPDIVHVWRPPMLRLAAFLAGRAPLVVSGACRTRREAERLHPVDRWLLRWARCVIARTNAEAGACAKAGIAADRIVLIPPGVPATQPAVDREKVLASVGLPPHARITVVVGPVEPEKGVRDAAWALDILKYLYDDLFMLVVGTGSEEAKLREFTRVTRVIDRIRYLGPRNDVTELMALAEVVWVPTRWAGGVTVTLEAMALGCPVVATHAGGLGEIVVEGDTGYLVEPGDKVGLARQTRALLENRERLQSFGEAGRRRARECFPAAKMVARHAALYEALARGELLPFAGPVASPQ